MQASLSRTIPHSVDRCDYYYTRNDSLHYFLASLSALLLKYELTLFLPPAFLAIEACSVLSNRNDTIVVNRLFPDCGFCFM